VPARRFSCGTFVNVACPFSDRIALSRTFQNGRPVSSIVKNENAMQERLQKIISRAGIASRRHAEQLILSGQVRVNGQVITELGSKADAEHDRIEAAGKLVEANERRVYIILNKPPEVVSTLADPEGRKTLRNCLRGLPERVYPVGRLDYDASGLVFLTNDGDLAAEMLKDWSNLEQSYHVKIKGRLLMEELERLGRNSGSTIRTVRQPDATRGHAENFWYEVTLQDSKKDFLRRVLFAEKHPVEKLKRIGLGPLNLEGVPQGRYRMLVDKEVEELRRQLKIKPKPRATFVPTQPAAIAPQPAPFIQERSNRPPFRDQAAAGRSGNRGGHSKHGPRPSRPPSPNRLEAEDPDDFPLETLSDNRPPFFHPPGKSQQDRGPQQFSSAAPPRNKFGGPRGGRDNRGEKPFGNKPFGGARTGKPFGKTGFGAHRSGPPRSSSGSPGENRVTGPRGNSDDRGERPFGKKPFGRPQGGRPFGKKPFGGPRDGKPFGAKPFGGPRGEKPFGKKPFGGPRSTPSRTGSNPPSNSRSDDRGFLGPRSGSSFGRPPRPPQGNFSKRPFRPDRQGAAGGSGRPPKHYGNRAGNNRGGASRNDRGGTPGNNRNRPFAGKRDKPPQDDNAPE
jgi:23S rRNA pseudouridine2605 synthase